ncbi:DNA polymerase III subunit alpha [Oenococcus alcoholitolerans]|uniref:DNA polymerase III subunit alpha n=1 Tax=Oenococcus alcoholitolerans TaxID=931074 RepID=UPI003F70CA4F
MSYTPVQLFSEYDLLKNPNKTNDLAEVLRERHFKAAVLANHNYLYGTEKFRQAAIKNGIKPIIGLTVASKNDREIILIAKKYSGYQNLIKISTWLAFNSKEDFEIMDHLSRLNDILIVLDDDKYRKIDDLDIVSKSQIGYVKIDWLKKGDEIAASAFAHIESNQQNFTGQAEIKGNYLENEDFYEKKINQEALKKNEEVFGRIKNDWPKKRRLLPNFPLPVNYKNSDEYISHLIELGIKSRFKGKAVPKEYLDRIEYEKSIIFQLRLSDYFLVVWDIVNFARHHNIQLGAGRGSAVGSLVVYSLYITSIDPIKYDLYFERFLNPKRAQLPDIDIDVPGNRRQEIIDYLQKKYSPENFSQIGTFDTFKNRLAVRDTARIFGSSEASLKLFSRFIAQNSSSLEKADPNNLPDQIANLPYAKEIITIAKKISGLPRHVGIHAAGVVLSPLKLVDFIPLNKISDIVVTQFDKNDVESLGLVKFDLLRLTNLDMLADMRLLIEENYGQYLNLDHVPLNDQKTLRLFANLQTNGIFQFESDSARRAMRQVMVSDFNDIVAVNALNRPGPSENIPEYAEGKNSNKKIDYIDPSLKKILKPTYGVIIYQEQVMQIAQVYAGFTMGEADIFRAAIGHKNEQVLMSQHDSFIQGAINNHHSKEQAEKIFDYIERFANYGFNKSHAVAYSKLAFELAYIKSHYQVEFFATLLNYDRKNSYIQEIKNSDIKLKGPEINYAKSAFTGKDDTIYAGFSIIKGLNRKLIDVILNERQKGGPFLTLVDFLKRMSGSGISANDLIALAYAGSLDKFGYTRSEIIKNAASLVTAMQFGGTLLEETKIQREPEMNLLDRLNHEKEILGFAISGHPIDSLKKEIKEKGYATIPELKANKEIKIAVMIDSIRITRDKNGNQMAFLTVSDSGGEVSVVVFARQYSKISNLLKNGSLIAIMGKTQQRNDEINIIANKIAEIRH